MMIATRRHWLKWISGLTLIALMAVVLTIAITMPALAAAACPACYGFERLAANVFVDSEMTGPQREELQRSVAGAETSIRSFFATLERKPRILACASERCDKALGGKGARAVTYSSVGFSVLRLSPRGLDSTIVTHEFAHVQVHAKIGVRHQMSGTVPAWFDEGLAVLISEDSRYLKSGSSASERCMGIPMGNLPVSPFQWGPLSGKTPTIYADAACSVLHWMEANGGKRGLLSALDDVAAGHRRLP